MKKIHVKKKYKPTKMFRFLEKHFKILDKNALKNRNKSYFTNKNNYKNNYKS